MELLVKEIKYKNKTFLSKKNCLIRNSHLFVFDIIFRI